MHSRARCGGGQRLVRQPQYIWEPAFNQASLLSGLQLEPTSPSSHLCQDALISMSMLTRGQMQVQILSCFWGLVPFLPVARAWPLFLPPSPSRLWPSCVPHVERLVCTGAANFACCNGCQLSPTSTRGEPQHPSRRAQKLSAIPFQLYTGTNSQIHSGHLQRTVGPLNLGLQVIPKVCFPVWRISRS